LLPHELNLENTCIIVLRFLMGGCRSRIIYEKVNFHLLGLLCILVICFKLPLWATHLCPYLSPLFFYALLPLVNLNHHSSLFSERQIPSSSIRSIRRLWKNIKSFLHQTRMLRCRSMRVSLFATIILGIIRKPWECMILCWWSSLRHH